MKIGLVLEGGALRGLFTMGILDVFMENGITYDGAVGVSAGVAFGCNIKSHQIGRVIRYNKNLSKNWRFKGVRSFLFTGDVYGSDFCYHELPGELDVFDVETFAKDPLDFWCVTTDVDSGLPYYHKLTDGEYDDLEWIRASASMPLVSRLVKCQTEEGERLMLDGGVSDSIPLKFMEDQGFGFNIVILTQPQGYIKHPYKIIPLAKMVYHKHKGIVSALENRPQMYNSQTAYVEKREAEGAAYVIRPTEALNIGAMERDPSEMDRVYNLGREMGLKCLEEVKTLIQQHRAST